MRVIEAESLGMCFGVRDALARIEEIEDPPSVTIWGELVHNESVVRDLRRRGFLMVSEVERRVPDTARVLVTAHGVSEQKRGLLESADKEVIDTTCPLVTRAHRAAATLAAAGRHVVVVGRADHVEVRGLTGDLEDFTVFESPGDVTPLPHDRIGVVFQTTVPTRRAEAVLAAVRRANPAADVTHIDTVCRATKDRQSALERLLEQVAVVVVVGGRNSNNTRALVERVRVRGLSAHQVEGPDELRPEWFAGLRAVGLTAGTSTPAAKIAAVRGALEALRPSAHPAAS